MSVTAPATPIIKQVKSSSFLHTLVVTNSATPANAENRVAPQRADGSRLFVTVKYTPKKFNISKYCLL